MESVKTWSSSILTSRQNFDLCENPLFDGHVHLRVLVCELTVALDAIHSVEQEVRGCGWGWAVGDSALVHSPWMVPAAIPQLTAGALRRGARHRTQQQQGEEESRPHRLCCQN